MNRHHDSPWSALMVEHGVASTPPHLAPTGLAESPQSFVAGDSRESRHSCRLGKILSVIVIVQYDPTDPNPGFWRSSVRGTGPRLHCDSRTVGGRVVGAHSATPAAALPFACSGTSTSARCALRARGLARALGVGHRALGWPSWRGCAARHRRRRRAGADQSHGLVAPSRLATPVSSASRYRSQAHCLGEVNTKAMGATLRTTRAG